MSGPIERQPIRLNQGNNWHPKSLSRNRYGKSRVPHNQIWLYFLVQCYLTINIAEVGLVHASEKSLEAQEREFPLIERVVWFILEGPALYLVKGKPTFRK